MVRNLNEKPKIPVKKDEEIINKEEKEAIKAINKPLLLNPFVVEPDTISEDLIDIRSYVFEKDKDKIQKNTVIVDGDSNTAKDTVWEQLKIPNYRNYNISFFNDNSAIKMSNSFVNGEYQQFTGGPYTSPGVGALIKFATIDLFEDKKIYGGVRISSSTREYFMTYQNLEKRTDKEYTFSRTTSNQQTDFNAFGLSTNTFNYSLKYPFSEVTSVRTTFSARNDNINVKSTEIVSLNASNLKEYRGVFKIAYVFDNTRNKMTNIYYGTKFKLFGEYYQEFGDGSIISVNRKFKSDGSLKGKGDGENGNMQVVGLDFRHSQKISREIVWVNRLAASSAFGYEKLIYYLGSTDDWIPIGQEQFINGDDIDFSVNYRYHALAANLRGFPQNIRRGTNFAVINSEIRIPVFKYFIRRPIRSKFIKNFQIIGFTDVGSAWNGLNPWSRDNRIDKDNLTDGPVTITVFKNLDPIVAGYGFGVRTTLLGYFLRLDWAWGVENGVAKEKPIFYLSLSLDI